jgi:energy-converting hydrogenase Eha subunit H
MRESGTGDLETKLSIGDYWWVHVKCFRLLDVKFTIRSLMFAVMAVAVCFAVLRAWRDFLLVFVLVTIPLLGLIGLWTRVPPQRVSWRFGVLAAMLGLIILGMGLVLGSLRHLAFSGARGIRGDWRSQPG